MLEDMYSQEDAQRILRNIRDSAHEGLKTQLELYGRMSSLYLQEIFRVAERNDISLDIDFSKLDDTVKLAGIEKVLGANTDAVGKKLRSIGGGGVDVKLVETVKDLEYKNSCLNQDFAETTLRIKKELKANVALKLKVESLKQQVKDAKRDYYNAKDGDEEAMLREIEQLKDEIYDEKKSNSEVALSKELETIKRELDGRIADSTQFRQLKLMIQAKNQQLKELRAARR